MSTEPVPSSPPPPPNRTLLYVGVGVGCVVLLIAFIAAASVGAYFFFRNTAKAPIVVHDPGPPPAPAPAPEPEVTPAGTPVPQPAPAPPASAPAAPPRAAAQPFQTQIFANSREGLDPFLTRVYLDAIFAYPLGWEMNENVRKEGRGFIRVQRPANSQRNDTESFQLSAWQRDPKTADQQMMRKLKDGIGAAFGKSMTGYREVSFQPTRVGLYEGMELKFASDEAGQTPLWGRVIFLQPQSPNQPSAPMLTLLAAGRNGIIRSADDVGVKGEMPLVLTTLRWGSDYARAGERIRAVAGGGAAAIVFSLLDLNEDDQLDGVELLGGTLARFDADRNGEVSRAEYLAGNPRPAGQAATTQPPASAPAVSAPTQRALPTGQALNDAKKLELVATTLEGFQAGIQRGSFRDFHGIYLSNLWKKQISAEQFEYTFKKFIDAKVDLQPAAFRETPVFSTDRKQGNIHKFAGAYQINSGGQRAEVTWELDFMYESGRGWGLTRISVFAKPYQQL